MARCTDGGFSAQQRPLADVVRFPEVFPLLETERLILREVLPGDADALLAIHADPETMRYWSRPPMVDIGEARELAEREAWRPEDRSALAWAVTRRGADALIGKVVLFAIDHDNRRAELGFILERAYWGQGYNHEALTRIVAFAFQGLRLNRIEADLDPRNDASAKALRRLGFAEEGLLRERWVVAGEVSDSLLAGLLRSDWEARQR